MKELQSQPNLEAYLVDAMVDLETYRKRIGCFTHHHGHKTDSRLKTPRNANKRFSGHKYDIKKRPDQNELSQHCHKHSHDPVQDLEIFIIDHGIKDLQARERLEDFYICKLQTMAPYGLNSSVHAYAKEMYTSWSSVLINDDVKSY